MISPKPSKSPKPDASAASKAAPVKTAPISDSTHLHDKIRSRAHELYVIRGREPGKEQQDWLQAENETRSPRR
jgi:Protein of unknown function (DUF2934)